MKKLISILSIVFLCLIYSKADAQTFVRGPYSFDYMQPDANLLTIPDPLSNRTLLIRVEMGYKFDSKYNYVNYGKVYGVISVLYTDTYTLYPHSLNFDVEVLALKTSSSSGTYNEVFNGPSSINWTGSYQIFSENYTSYQDHLPIYYAFQWGGSSNITF